MMNFSVEEQEHESTTILTSTPYQHLLVCPHCRGALESDEAVLTCRSCSYPFPIQRGIPLLYWPNDPKLFTDDVTEVVKAFYQEHPFPDYEDTDNLARLIDKAQQGVFARLLDEQIPFGARVLDCGCGTGQLANFLGIAHRTVFGTDICLNSLGLAQQFKQKNRLERVHFLQMNLFRPVFRPASFDTVICNGVLHHTSHPPLGFETLSTLVKPSGYLIVGLYHRYGRLATDLRRILFQVTGYRLAFLDPRLRSQQLGKTRHSAWFADQYENPHELKHTISQVLKWLEPSQLELVKTIPKTRLLKRFSSNERLFEPESSGHLLERSLIELGMIFNGAREGGFFTVIARKKP
ncbi:class I SAM-dependent methyltransferase [Acidobacteria bacterium AH-259-A15]|nr:class I SAM-dependent methyltransferase [Acidobacteria bacterium AH-259-A15]